MARKIQLIISAYLISLTAIFAIGCNPALNRVGLAQIASLTALHPLTLTTPVNNVNPVNTVTHLTGATGRAGHTVTALPNGKVLIVGGVSTFTDAYTSDYTTILGTAFLFDPINSSFTATGSLLTPRTEHLAVYIPGVNKVLVVGGISGAAPIYTTTVETYDVATGLWSAANSMVNGSRVNASITYVPSLGKVLVVGGSNNGSSCGQAIAELYDPVANSWANTTNAPNARYQYHDAIVLNNGKILLGGGDMLNVGRCAPPMPGGNSTFGLFDPSTQTWASGGNQTAVFWYGRFHALSNGTVVIYARCAGLWCTQNDTRSYDPVTNSWATNTFPAPIPASNRFGEASVMLANDVIYRIGGMGGATSGGGGANVDSTNIFTYTHSTDTWVNSALTLGTAVHNLQAVKANAGIFAFGGIDATFAGKNNYFLYQPYNPIALVTAGGTGPFTYAVTSGNGTVNIDTGVFYPGVAETATITVTDSLGATATVNVTSN